MKNKPTARLHHYLPQSYLGHFTNTGRKDGKLYVLDINTGRTFRPTPKNIAAERDFNRVDIDGHSPDVIENALAEFEDKAIQAIRNTIATKTFPASADCNLILNLICLIAVRNPKLRKSFNNAKESALHMLGELLVSDEKIWNHHLSKALESGYISDTNVSFEEMRKFISERKYQLEFIPESNLRSELKTFDVLLPILGKRTWSLLVAPDNGPELICSDHPVVLTWKNNSSNPVGFELHNTEVYFPLSPYQCFYGCYENFLPLRVNLTPTGIAKVNLRISLNAEKFVFSRQEKYIIYDKDQIREVSFNK